VKESTARYRQAKAELDRLAAEVTGLEARLADVDGRQAALRSLATRGAAALYMHDSTIEWVGGFGDGGEDTLDAARRARLVGNVSDLAGAAIRDLADSTRQIDEDRRRLQDKHHEQEVALRRLDTDRQAAAGRFSSMVAAEQDDR